MCANKRKSSVTKAFKEVVFPLMKKDGFVQLKSKYFARIVENDVLQSIFIYVDGRYRRSYEIHYCSLIMSEPHEDLTLEIGGRFEKLSSGNSYGAVSEKMLETTIQRAAIAYNEDALPKLQEKASLKGMLKAYLNLRKARNYDDPHTLFSIACIYAVLDDENNALGYAKETYELCKSIEHEERFKEVTTEKIELSSKLIESIKIGEYHNLLQEWRRFTINNLKLENLVALTK